MSPNQASFLLIIGLMIYTSAGYSKQLVRAARKNQRENYVHKQYTVRVEPIQPF